MTPVMCHVRHDPENGLYGDCLRACIASLLDFGASDVPHFCHDNADDIIIQIRIRTYLKSLGYAPMWTAFTGQLDDVFTLMRELNNGFHYILYGGTSNGDHVVVCKDDKILHNPAWFSQSFVGPTSTGAWVILVLVRL